MTSSVTPSSAAPDPATTTSAAGSHQDEQHDEDVSQRLLDSAAKLSYDPEQELDWEAPLRDDQYGLNPEWSTLYGTALWDEMSQEQRIALTRHEVCSIMSTGIWFEMILQQMVLRDQYVQNPANSEFQFALTEIADECRHSIMFARACEKMGVRAYFPGRASIELGRAFKTLATAENAYGGILVAEEVLDVMQRDWMRGEDVLPIVRGTSKIHVVEESRHMKFARQEIRERTDKAGPVRKWANGTLIAAVAYFIVTNMVNKGVYSAVGLDERRAVAEARQNEHHKSMFRSSCKHLMEFLSEAGLLNRTAMGIYKRINMV